MQGCALCTATQPSADGALRGCGAGGDLLRRKTSSPKSLFKPLSLLRLPAWWPVKEQARLLEQAHRYAQLSNKLGWLGDSPICIRRGIWPHSAPDPLALVCPFALLCR